MPTAAIWRTCSMSIHRWGPLVPAVVIDVADQSREGVRQGRGLPADQLGWAGLGPQATGQRAHGSRAQERERSADPRRCHLHLYRWQAWRAAGADPGGAGRPGIARSHRRQRLGAGGRVRLLQQQIQPRGTGQNASRARASNPSCIPRRWRTASPPPRCCGCPDRDRRQRHGDCVAAQELAR